MNRRSAPWTIVMVGFAMLTLHAQLDSDYDRLIETVEDVVDERVGLRHRWVDHTIELVSWVDLLLRDEPSLGSGALREFKRGIARVRPDESERQPLSCETQLEVLQLDAKRIMAAEILRPTGRTAPSILGEITARYFPRFYLTLCGCTYSMSCGFDRR